MSDGIKPHVTVYPPSGLHFDRWMVELVATRDSQVCLVRMFGDTRGEAVSRLVDFMRPLRSVPVIDQPRWVR